MKDKIKEEKLDVKKVGRKGLFNERSTEIMF